ncbi:glutaminyl-peptide cyclotransferase [Haloflavibacter putidus]|uniref:Glutaminyl-peptide cyclotransferase n=1 Tax=Haloflavibacter putidus TaxID=2576776 RepID=A0A507ZST4_9FLAO|nr:glutaminyl-peptide cyclotransferase [Haloflavibacter putidus]TQD39314.1 glutaminyl-peptide cyclotransferase [Haloflavibacter putidus]
MKKYKVLVFFCLSILLLSCGKNTKNAAENFILKTDSKKGPLQKGDALKLSVKSKKDYQIDSVVYSYGNNKLAKSIKNEPISVNLEKPFGNNILKASVYFEDTQIEINKNISLHSKTKPIVYGYEIINSYPHDNEAFTQGLEFYKDTLYESTGQHGKSSLRKVEYKTGKVLKKVDLNPAYFGEGLTILNDKIYLLTWRSGDGFIYDVNTFEHLETFSYNKSNEGWGICNDGEKLYKSDGTEKIWILDPETLKELRYFQPVTHKTVSTKLNELEYAKGKIYANTWQKDGVAIINPETGVVEGIIDLRGLRKKLENNDKLTTVEHVLNGIAYHEKSGNFFVTGKNWDTLFEIKIFEK